MQHTQIWRFFRLYLWVLTAGGMLALSTGSEAAVRQVSAGMDHTCMLDNTGVVCWGIKINLRT